MNEGVSFGYGSDVDNKFFIVTAGGLSWCSSGGLQPWMKKEGE
jgi:hypothetical protein